MALDGTTAYLVNGGGYSQPSRVRKLVTGSSPVVIGPELPNAASIAFANGELHAAGATKPDFSDYVPRYLHFAPTATSAVAEILWPSWQYTQAYNVQLAASSGGVAASYEYYDRDRATSNTYFTRRVGGQWAEPLLLATYSTTRWIAVTPSGEAWAAYVVGSGWATVRLGDNPQTLTLGAPLRLRINPSGVPVLVASLPLGGVGISKRVATAWGAAESVSGDAWAADVAWGPDGTAWLAIVPATSGAPTIRLLRRPSNGTWSEVGQWTPSSGTDFAEGLQLGVDARGRLHVTYASSRWDATQGISLHALRHALVCP
jgi:hypothetical protein